MMAKPTSAVGLKIRYVVKLVNRCRRKSVGKKKWFTVAEYSELCLDHCLIFETLFSKQRFSFKLIKFKNSIKVIKFKNNYYQFPTTAGRNSLNLELNYLIDYVICTLPYTGNVSVMIAKA